jgi:hypothetical protein
MTDDVCVCGRPAQTFLAWTTLADASMCLPCAGVEGDG